MRPARLSRWAVLGGAGAAVALVLVPALTLWPAAFHGVMSPLTELAARLRDLVGR